MARYFGKLCAKHAELQGLRRNGNCPSCMRERARDPEYRRRHRATPAHRRKVHKWREANWVHFSRVKVARNAALRATSKGATGDSPAVRRAYVEFARKAKALGMVPDHVIPLTPCRVCGRQGTHAPGNWQMLTGRQNSSKGNRCQRCWRVTLSKRLPVEVRHVA